MTVTLYSKPGCHLCEEVRASLEELQTEFRFTLEEVDITDNAELFARYRYEIPVVWSDDKEIARGRITAHELFGLLRR